MRRLLPLLLLVILAVAASLLLRHVGWGTLARHQLALHAWVDQHALISAAIYLAAYTVTAALSLPQAAILTVAGGLLFGTVFGGILAVVGATLGSAILVIVLRSTLVEMLSRYRDRIPRAVRDRLVTDGFSYLLALRLVPLFPFWLVNLAAALAGLRLATFVPATLIGIIPASFILSSIGASVSTLLAEGRAPDLSVLFSPRILLPLAGLAALSLLPALFRRRRGANA